MSDPGAPTGAAAMAHHDAEAMMRYDANKKSVVVAYILWFFFGSLGAHRFYLKRTGSAVAMLVIFVASIVLSVTGIGFLGYIVLGLWVLVDAFLIPGMTRDYNNRLITSLER
jgi:TM2 domain-containing membrane protein YozV